MLPFINPLLLFGALLAAVPIILHLIMRQKPRHMVFPAMQFLRARHQANSRRLRLRHWLLLAMRVLLIALLALALARPRVLGGPATLAIDQEAPVAAVMVFDTSPRMTYQQNNQSRLELAQETAEWLVAQMPAESDVAVLDSSRPPVRYEPDVVQAQKRIGLLEPTNTPQPLAVLLEDALTLLEEKDDRRRELYVMTDLSEPAWTSGSLSRFRDRLKELGDVGVYVVDVGAEDPQNFALGPVSLTKEVVSRNSDVRLRTELRAVGAGGSRTVEVLLQDTDGQLENRQSLSIDLSRDASQPLEFPLAGLPEGVHQGEVRILGDDGLALDDRRYFTLDVRPAWKVLLVGQEPGDVSYMEWALSPSEYRRRQAARYQTSFITYEELADHKLRNEYAVVCLVDPPPLTTRHWTHLQEYVINGGGLAVFLGRNAAADVGAFNTQPAQKLLPAQVADIREGDDLYLTYQRQAHPVLLPFLALEDSPWRAFPVLKYYKTEGLAEQAQRLMSYTNADGALFDRNVGQGKVMLLTTTVADAPSSEQAWNFLVLDWPFLMLSDQMMLHLAGTLQGQFNYQIGPNAAARVLLPAGLPQTTFAVAVPDGEILSQASTPGETELMITPLDQPGNYRIRGTTESGIIERGISANYPLSESLLIRADEARLAEVFDDYPYQVARNKEQIERAQNFGRVGVELFPIIMGVIVALLIFEGLLSNFFYRNAPETR